VGSSTSGSSTGSSGNTSNSGTGTDTQGLFTTVGDGVQIGNNQGRFTTNVLGGQSTATSGTSGTGQSTRSTFGGNARGSRGFGGQTGGQFNLNRLQQGFGGTSTSKTIRPALVLGFTPLPRPAPVIDQNVTRRLEMLTARVDRLADTRPDFASVSFNVSGDGVAVLQGSVPTESASRLAANLLRMEPGIRKVQNNLTVAQAPAASE